MQYIRHPKGEASAPLRFLAGVWVATTLALAGCGGGNGATTPAMEAVPGPSAKSLAAEATADVASDTGDDAPEQGRSRPLQGYFWTTAARTGAPVFHRALPLWLNVASGQAIDARLPAAHYAVRWAAALRFPVEGVYQFRLSVGKHDQVRMQFVNDSPISFRPPVIPELFNVQTGAAGSVVTATRTQYVANAAEPFTVDLIDAGDGARLQLEWKLPGAADFVRVPASAIVTAGLGGPRRVGERVLPVPLDKLVLSLAGPTFQIRDGAAALGFRTVAKVVSADARLGLTPTVSIPARPGRADPSSDPMLWDVVLGSFVLRALGDYPLAVEFTNVVGHVSTVRIVVRVTQPEPWATVTGGSFLPDVDIPPYYLQPAEKPVSGWQAEDRWEFLRTALLVSATRPNPITAGLPALGSDNTSMVGLQYNGGIRQRLWLAAGDQLVFSATQRLQDSAGDQTIGVFVDGVRQGPPILPPRGVWSRHTVGLQPDRSGGHYVELRGLGRPGGPDRTVLVDDIAVVQGPGWHIVEGFNGSFEAPALANGEALHLVGPGDPTQWGGSADSVLDIAAPDSPFTVGTPAAPDGRQVAALWLDTSAVGARLSLQPGDTLLFAATKGASSADAPDYCRARAISVVLDGLYQGIYEPTPVGAFSFNREAFVPGRGEWANLEVPLRLPVARTGELQLTVGSGAFDCASSTLVDRLRIRRLK
jgi:hypothetical protein